MSMRYLLGIAIKYCKSAIIYLKILNKSVDLYRFYISEKLTQPWESQHTEFNTDNFFIILCSSVAHHLLRGSRVQGLPWQALDKGKQTQVKKMTRKHCSKKTRKIIKFRENYDEDYGWEDYLDDQNTKKKSKKQQRKNPLKDKW